MTQCLDRLVELLVDRSRAAQCRGSLGQGGGGD